MKFARAGLRLLGVACVLACLLPMSNADARAGGGRSSSSSRSSGYSGGYHSTHVYHHYSGGYSGGYYGGGSGGWVGPLIFIGGAVAVIGGFVYFASRKRKKLTDKADAVLEKLVEQDPLWDKERMLERVEEVFMRVQEAWAECNQDLARDCMTQGLYQQHKAQTDGMLRRGERNVLQNVNLVKAEIVSVDDRDDDRKDKFWVLVTGSMADFTIIEASGEVIDGDPDEVSEFTELWKFVRERQQWVLASISEDTSLANLQEAKSESIG